MKKIIIIIALAAVALNSFAGVVTSTEDEGAGTLRAVIGAAIDGEDITFDLTYPATIVVTSNFIDVHKVVNIIGRPDPRDIVIDGEGSASNIRIFDISTNCVISGVTITNGIRSDGNSGGGIYIHVEASGFTMSNCVVASCSTYRMGGGIYASGGDVTLIDCTFNNNKANSIAADGGAMFLDAFTSGANAQRRIENCTFYDNASDDDSGAIQTRRNQDIEIINSTFYNNSAADEGGAIGIYLNTGSIKVYNCTLVGNTGGNGGGIGTYGQIGGQGELYSTVLDNTSANGPNLSDMSSFDIIEYSIFPEAPAGSGNVTATPDVSTILEDNGGPTLTLAIDNPGNCIDAGDNPLSLLYDQRGAPRTSGAATDIGSVELVPEPALLGLAGIAILAFIRRK